MEAGVTTRWIVRAVPLHDRVRAEIITRSGPYGLTAREIADRLGEDVASIQRHLDQMQADGSVSVDDHVVDEG
jgi:predicted ArsR family transcriptional regulator